MSVQRSVICVVFHGVRLDSTASKATWWRHLYAMAGDFRFRGYQTFHDNVATVTMLSQYYLNRTLAIAIALVSVATALW